MPDTSMNFMDFLEGIYGRSAKEDIASLTGMSADDLQKAAQAFTPAFLQGLMSARRASGLMGQAVSQSSGMGMPSFASFWPDEMKDAMQSLMEQSTEAARKMSKASSEGADASYPFNLFADQKDAMDQLYTSFMGKSMQDQLCEQTAQATGIPAAQLKALYPVLTTYGLIPLIPPALDDPAGWVDYLGDMGRRNMKQASRELEAMPSPVSAAFEGLLAGLYPKSQASTEPELSEEEQAAQKMAELKDATLEMQTNYIKGLNSLFESYQAGFDKGEDGKS